MKIKTVLIFGAFDGVHEGHSEFIQEAKLSGSRLVAVVARDKSIIELKNKTPLNNENIRFKSISKIKEVDEVFLGDEDLGTYKVLRKIKPDLIFLGYDQQGLYEDLIRKMEKGIIPKIEIIFGKPHFPEKFHSSILNKKRKAR